MRVDEAYIVSNFDRAVREGWITAYYQPIYRTMTGRVCAAEALARWEDPEKGLLTPPDFIDVLERNQLIYRLDLAILRQVCQTYCRLLEAGTPVHAFSVNFCRLDFMEPDLFERVSGILDEYNVPHSAIKLEITESVMLENPERFGELFNAFRGAGFTVWIDDFGSGFSSLNLLQEYDFDLLKVDMMFLRNFTPRSRQMITTVVNMAKSLNIHTLVEGLENEEQLRFLKSIGCEAIQGFYYSRPVSEAALSEKLKAERAETMEDQLYWNAAGRFNLLSPNPLESFGADGESVEAQFRSDIPLALLECNWQTTRYVYASEEYLKRVRTLGFASIDSLEDIFNAHASAMYGPLRSLILESITRDTVQEMDYVTGEVYYKFKVRCIAKSKAQGKAMIAACLRTFDSEQDFFHRSELMKYGQALYATCEHVNVLYPDRDVAERIFSRANFQNAYQRGSLHDGVRSFCENEVYAPDRARYMRFFDIDTLKARVTEAEGQFLQQPFRINAEGGGYEWRTIRITHVSSVMEDMYLYTIQRMPAAAAAAQIAEIMLSEHPELME